jgi:LuxR family transcriptional regulator, maltose regulon positive regulatory protein
VTAIDAFAAATRALERGAWEEARAQLQTGLAAQETPQALEQLGLVAWWLDDAPLTFDARERAYRLYRDQGDARGAARLALWLVWDSLAFRGDTAVASGWLERARRLLAGHEQTAEYGWLLLRDGEFALFRGHDPTAARERGVRAAALGRATGDRGLEFTGLALEGLARVSAGDVVAGMRCLDEASAAATAGEVKELHTVGVVCCWQIFACERVGDYERAAQWCARVQEFSKRWHLRPLSAICRTQYAGVLIWRGGWADAEAELAAATRDLELARPPLAVQALARLGELRRRQGRLDEAARLFERAESQPVARLGQAMLALDRGAPEEAAAAAERFLAQVGEGEATSRAGALALLARARAECGDAAAAARAGEELQRIAQALGTTPLAAAVAATQGILLRRQGNAAAAATRFEAAAALYDESGAPFETARARLDLVDALAALGGAQRATAEREARRAFETFRGLGAEREAGRAKGWLERLATGPRPGGTQQLTKRQLEILQLIAQGLSNSDIAARLRLSDHTVKRHVANLLAKLRLSSRAAAAAYAARQGLL